MMIAKLNEKLAKLNYKVDFFDNGTFHLYSTSDNTASHSLGFDPDSNLAIIVSTNSDKQGMCITKTTAEFIKSSYLVLEHYNMYEL